MKYISTKEASQQWNISVRRVRGWCQEGKIDGAILVGTSWQIPDNAQKPIDGRTKKGKEKKPIDKLYLYLNPTYCENKVEYSLSEEDKTLCQIENMFYCGQIKEAEKELKSFIKTCDRDYLFTANALLYDISLDIAKKTPAITIPQKERKLALSGDYPYSALYRDLFIGNEINLYEHNIPAEYQPLFSYMYMKQELLNKVIKSKNNNQNMSIYEIIVGNIDKTNNPVISMYSHNILAVIYSLMGNNNACDIHQRKSAEIALERGMITCIAEYGFALDWSFIKDMDQKAYKKIDELANMIVNNYINIGVFKTLFTKYKTRDINVIRTAFLYAKGKTQNEIGYILNTSPYHVKKYLDEVQKITGLQTREEIAEQIIANFDLL